MSEEPSVSSETTKIDTTTTKPYVEFKISEILIVLGEKVLAVNESGTNLRFNICAKHLEKESCCKTKHLYSKDFTKPHGVARFGSYHELGTCLDFVVGMKSNWRPGTNY